MLAYIAKRLFLFLPTLVVLSLVFFTLSKLASGDALKNKIEASYKNSSAENVVKRWEYLKKEKQKYHLLLPNFYISVHRYSSSDTLYAIQDEKIKQSLINLSYEYGSWQYTNSFFGSVKEVLNSELYSQAEKNELIQIIRQESPNKIAADVKQLSPEKFEKVKNAFNRLVKYDASPLHFLPEFSWNGVHNQYHYWVAALFNSSSVTTYSGEIVSEKISRAIFWTLLISIFSVFISFSIGIGAAFIAARNEGQLIDTFFSRLFFILYSVPNFWFAGMMILLFASSEVFNLFPSYGLGIINDDASLWQTFMLRAKHLLLPIICISYGSIAYIFRQVRNALIAEKGKDYYVTARAKGLTEKVTFRKHLFKNAIFPLITIIGKVLPAVFTGSFVIEYIFSIPGMGKLTIDSFLSRDFPLVFSIVMMISFFSLLGILIADILYFLSDPRVKFHVKNRNT